MTPRASLPLCVLLTAMLTSCSGTPSRATITYSAGDKAPVDKLTYSVVDTQIFPHLGDEKSPRMPRNRFYVVQLSVSNAGESDTPIAGMTLVDDSGKTYEELPDGTGVPHWLGVVRKVQANQTEMGSVVFDAPAGHYKLKVSDDTDPADVFVDLPLSFAHEQLQNDAQSASDVVTQTADEPAPVKKKK